jgi:hypothetical protein
MKVVSFNANGIRSNFDEILYFLTDLNVDIALIQETHLYPHQKSPSSHPYIFLRADRRIARQDPTARCGGVAILIHKRHSFTQLTIPTLHSNIECIAALIPLNGTPVAFISFYQPPTVTNINSIDLETIFSIYPRVFVGGDYNARHTDLGCVNTNTRGRSLLDFLENTDLPISLHVPNSPTHYHTINNLVPPDILDLALSTNLSQIPLIDVIQDLSSDHLPVLFTFTSIHPNRVGKTKVNWRNFHNIMEANLRAPPQALASPAELDEHVVNLTNTIKAAMQSSSTPMRLQRRSNLPPQITEALREKRRLRRLWQLTRSPLHKRLFSKATEHCSALLFKHRINGWEDFLLSLEGNHSPWKACRTLLKENKTTSPLQTETGIVFDEAAKVRVFGEHFTKHFTTPTRPPSTVNLNTAHDEAISLVVGQCLSSESETIPPFSKDEVSLVLKKLNVKKAPGCDAVTGFALVNSPPILIDHLLLIFNTILQLQHFPQSWKESEICLILKPKKPPTKVTSYRPISLLPILSKLFEKLLIKQIKPTVDNLLRPEQFGFRTGYSTTLQLMRFASDISDAKNSSNTLSAVLIDFHAAFDTVWHLGLLYKLSRIFSPAMLRLIKSYLSGRKFRIATRNPLRGNFVSTLFPIEAGVPQGSVLGPVLYTVYINDVQIEPNIKVALYADDVVFYTTSRNFQALHRRLQKQLDSFASWSAKWRTRINHDKCEAITFTNKQLISCPDPVSIDGHRLDWKSDIKYLGVTFDKNFNFKKHVTEKVLLGRVLLRKLFPILSSRVLPIKVKKLVFTMIIRAYLTYAAPIWFPFLSKSNQNKVSGFHNRALRTVGNFHYRVPNSDVHSFLDVPPLLEHIRLTSRQLHDRSMASPRPIIRELFSTQRPPPRKTAVPTMFGLR